MAKSRSIGGIYASLSLKDGGFKAGLRNARKSLDGFADGVASFAKGAVLAAPAAAFAGIVVSMKSAIDAGGALNDMMARTGAAGEGLFVMQRAFENAGIAGDKVPSVLNKMQKAMAGVNEDGELTNKAFEKLKLSTTALTSKDPVAAFKDIAKAISSIPDPAQRAAIAMELFGKSGGELLAVFTDSGAFAQAEQQVGSLGKTLADNAAKLDAVGDALGGIGTKFQVIGAEMAVEFLPQMEQLAEKMNEMDFQSFGQGLGDVTSKTLKWAGALAKAAQYMPGQAALNWMVEKSFGGPADMEEAKRQAAKMTEYDPAGTVKTPYYTDNLPVPDEAESIRWFKNGGFAEAMRGVNGFPEPSYGVPSMLEDPNAKFSTIIPEILQRVDEDRSKDAPMRPDVNAYQAMGLSLGGESKAAKSQDETNSLLRDIKSVLKGASKDGIIRF